MIGARRAGPSKATAATLCQKCLKRDIYECTTAPQDRPYKSRPSRTKQLADPQLMPKLSSDTHNDLLRKQGVADEHLARVEAERERRRPASSRSRSPSHRQRRRCSRSSSGSISTISTNRSPSPHPMQDVAYPSQQASQGPIVSRKRRRGSSSSSGSSSSHSIATASSYDRHGLKSLSVGRDRNTRRRRSSVSPEGRGRSRDYSKDQHAKDRGRPRNGSMNRSKIARHRHSMTPEFEPKSLDKEQLGRRYPRPATNRVSPSGERLRGETDRTHRREREPRERSLSPFSKRVALTKSINAGH